MKKLLSSQFLNHSAVILYMFYVAYWTIVIAKHLDFGDSFDYFAHQTVNLTFLETRYNTWSSRLIIESILVFLSKHSNLFLILNTVIMLLLPYVLWKLFEHSKVLSKNVSIIIFLVMFYNFNDMWSAGWIATITNYYYPLFFGLVSLLMIKNENINNNIWGYLILNLCLIFACNLEQCCVILLPIFAYRLLISKRYGYYALPVIITVVSLIFILTTPGNYARFLSNQGYWLPDFVNYTLEYKLYLGFQTTIYRYFFEWTPLFICFIALLAIHLYRKKGVSAELLPLLVILLLPILNLSDILVPRVFDSLNNYYINYGLFILSVFLSLQVLLLLGWYAGDRKTAFTMIAILLIGFVARLLMGASPSLFASSDRTFIFTDFAMLILSLILIDLLNTEKLKTNHTHPQ